MYTIRLIMYTLVIATNTAVNAMEQVPQRTATVIRKDISFLEAFMMGELTMTKMNERCLVVAKDFEKPNSSTIYQRPLKEVCELLLKCSSAAEQNPIAPVIEKLKNEPSVEQKRIILSNLSLEEKWQLQVYYYLCFMLNKDLEQLPEQVQEEIKKNRQDFKIAFNAGVAEDFIVASAKQLHVKKQKNLNERIQEISNNIAAIQTADDIIKLISFDTTLETSLINSRIPNSIQSVGLGLVSAALVVASAYILGK